MSAIWGCIDLSGKKIANDLPDKMSYCTKKYKIDRTEHMLDDNVYMACGIQYITAESRYEKLPCKSDDIFFTADCIIDNRQELIDILGLSNSSTDGELLFSAWKKWGEVFGDHVIGLFAFAVYEKTKNEFHLYTDHTSSRVIHYYYDSERIYFATLTTCIYDVVPTISINEKWMCACQAINIAYMHLYENETPFEGIYMLSYGTGIRVKYDNEHILVDTIRYWDPLKTIKQDKIFDDERCRNEFIKTHIDCVRDSIRTDSDVAVQLSSGLDSTSVASVAAILLAKEGKDLFSYTSVPLREFKDKYCKKLSYDIDDETDGVLKFCSYYPNIKPEFMECVGNSVWSYVENWCDYMEFPGKSFVNHDWMNDSYAKAYKKGCRVLLSGEFGNYTISYGVIEESALKLVKQFRFLEMYRQLMLFINKERLRKKSFFSFFIKYLINSISPFTSKKKYEEIFDKKAFKAELLKKNDLENKWIEYFENQLKHYKCFCVNPMLYQLIGLYRTKDSLYHGVLIRDPTMDKRMIELCLRLPFQCFAWNGVERRLVREYLAGYVPDTIRLTTQQRGRQRGDASMRMDMYRFPNGKQPWEKVTEKLEKYYDINKVTQGLKEKSTYYNEEWKAKVISCACFLERYDKRDR